MMPVVVLTVRTGKPICKVQRSMMVLTVLGRLTFLFTACPRSIKETQLEKVAPGSGILECLISRFGLLSRKCIPGSLKVIEANCQTDPPAFEMELLSLMPRNCLCLNWAGCWQHGQRPTEGTRRGLPLESGRQNSLD